jgi:D-sedoheptulose 7-phosphate isomerase
MFNVDNYFNTSSKVINNLKNHKSEIYSIAQKIIDTKNIGNKILVAGNGGSCADADHFTGELQCTYKDSQRSAVSAINIGGMPASITAWANDFGFETYFERQVKAHGNEGDILFLISTGGGNLENGASTCLIKAADEAKKKEMFLISLVGKSGGELKKTSDICIHVANNTTAFIQEAHMSIMHCICEILETELDK